MGMRSAPKWIIAVSSMLALLFASAASSAPNAESERVLIFEINGVKLYVPELWIWPNKAAWKTPAGVFLHPNPRILPSDPPGTVYRVDRAIALFLRANGERLRFSQLPAEFWVHRLELEPGPGNLAKKLRRTLDDLPPMTRTHFGPIDEDGFRQVGPPDGLTFYGTHPDDVDRGGWPLSFRCNSTLSSATIFPSCSADRSAIDGLRIRYWWVGKNVPKAEWRRMDRRVQALVEWLATPPDQRTKALEN
jgi:hypothetical protein